MKLVDCHAGVSRCRTKVNLRNPLCIGDEAGKRGGPKQGYQWPHKNVLYPLQIFLKIRKKFFSKVRKINLSWRLKKKLYVQNLGLTKLNDDDVDDDNGNQMFVQMRFILHVMFTG